MLRTQSAAGWVSLWWPQFLSWNLLATYMAPESCCPNPSSSDTTHCVVTGGREQREKVEFFIQYLTYCTCSFAASTLPALTPHTHCVVTGWERARKRQKLHTNNTQHIDQIFAASTLPALSPHTCGPGAVELQATHSTLTKCSVESVRNVSS